METFYEYYNRNTQIDESFRGFLRNGALAATMGLGALNGFSGEPANPGRPYTYDTFYKNNVSYILNKKTGLDKYGKTSDLISNFSTNTSNAAWNYVKNNETLGNSQIFKTYNKTYNKKTTVCYKTYKDSLGKNTVGVGFCLTEQYKKVYEYARKSKEYCVFDTLGRRVTPTYYNIKKAGFVSKACIDYCTQQLWKENQKALKQRCAKNKINFESLPNSVQIVLMDMSWQLGTSIIGKWKNLTDCVRERDWFGLAKEIQDSKVAESQASNRQMRNAQIILKMINKYNPNVVSDVINDKNNMRDKFYNDRQRKVDAKYNARKKK